MRSIFYHLGKTSAQDGGDRAAKLIAAGVAVAVLLSAMDSFPSSVVATVALLALAVVTVKSAVEIVDATEKRALTVLGTYRGLLDPGIHFVPPFVSATHTFDSRTQTVELPRQEAITRDNSPVSADAVVYIRVMDAKRAFLEVEDYREATSNLAQTTLRAVIGNMELDDTLSRRREINARIMDELNEPTDEWGVRVESVEVQEVKPSAAVEDAMEQQTSAERRRRAMILDAQGERRSAIERAEGERQSAIIRAQGEKQSAVLSAQGDAVSTVLRAKASESMGERAIVDRGMEALQRIGQAESTTYVMPQELTSLLGRYGKQLTGSDVAVGDGTLESQSFDDETREWLGLDDVDELIGGVDTVDTSEEMESTADDTQAEQPLVERPEATE